MKTLGISPKLLAHLVAAVIGYVLARFAVNIHDPNIDAAIGAASGVIAGFLAPPGDVVAPVSDAELQAAEASLPDGATGATATTVAAPTPPAV